MKDDSAPPKRLAVILGSSLARLLLQTRAAFLRDLEGAQLSKDYLAQSGKIIDEYADFCEEAEAGQPWQLRQRYLASRAARWRGRPFSDSYLKERGRLLSHFLCWYGRQLTARKVVWGQLSSGQLRAYWRTQPKAPPCRRRRLEFHLTSLLEWLQQRPEAALSNELGALVTEYLEQHRQVQRGRGYGLVLTHRARIVTRRHLLWLQEHGYLPAAIVIIEASAGSARGIEVTPQIELDVSELPEGERFAVVADYVSVKTTWQPGTAIVSTDAPAKLNRNASRTDRVSLRALATSWRSQHALRVARRSARRATQAP